MPAGYLFGSESPHMFVGAQGEVEIWLIFGVPWLSRLSAKLRHDTLFAVLLSDHPVCPSRMTPRMTHGWSRSYAHGESTSAKKPRCEAVSAAELAAEGCQIVASDRSGALRGVNAHRESV